MAYRFSYRRVKASNIEVYRQPDSASLEPDPRGNS